MRGNEYHFITHWRVEGTINEVADILKEANELPRWWPAVYLDAQMSRKVASRQVSSDAVG